jgi:DNA-binding MarR family transcriptional regulator
MSKRKSPSRPEDLAQLERAYTFFNEVGIISQLASNQMQRAMPHELTLSQFSVLNWFARVDDVATPGRLSSAFQVTKGAMTNTLHKLADKGLIKVVPDPDSGRRKIVRMTRKGHRARADAIASTHPQLEEFLSEFAGSKFEAGLEFMQRVRCCLDAERE